MQLNKYSKAKKGTSGRITSGGGSSSGGYGSNLGNSNNSNRILWGNDDDGVSDINDSMTIQGNTYIVGSNYDDSDDSDFDDENNEIEIPDYSDKFEESDGCLYVERKCKVDGDIETPECYGKSLYVDYNSTKTNILDLLLPIGSIIMFSGSSAIPNGWAICNGSNGTPNLLGKFIKGVGSASDVGATGGSSSVTLTTDNMPSHSHTATTTVNLTKSSDTEPTVPNRLNNQKIITYGETFYQAFDLGGDKHYTAETGYESAQDKGIEEVTVNDLVDIANSGTNGGYSASATTTIGNSGNGTEFNIEPPYYSLIYIMKVS